MKIWQADFYKHPGLKDTQGKVLWELIICDEQGNLVWNNQCPQNQANSDWLVNQLEAAATEEKFPELIQVFRPQSLSLLTVAVEKLGIKIEATRRTVALKKILEKHHGQVKIEQPPPQALPENIWGKEWRFASLPAGEIVEIWRDRPIPILDLPPSLFPINLGISSTIPIPGVVIYGGKKSLQLARWLQEAKPVALNYIPNKINESGGLVLEVGLVERWLFTTFADSEIAQAAAVYHQRKIASAGLHFLLVQPDDSGMTYTGFWLLL
ncbi:MAG: Tab2/Atab2 family RNA-binding protein [Gomphosphaeria aponina SAG 52.96 = DSM 107014]|uniref:Tab2/Atab2 family RNA-binding protein n=1 Tax=Gomphosphaeria aponina SAG 52.96 = DSM 107014 TaxID=1521640 RepID=A0A941JTJ9_9CHRO|nr:Tab2/Atab2 family RNA-binding protein [Gomphosphaeria aponina SAG 52.96 = DSM 107014]